MQGITAVLLPRSDFIPSSLVFNPALDGVSPHILASMPSVNDESGDAGGAEACSRLAALVNGLELPLQQWERQRRLWNVGQLTVAAAPFLLGLMSLTLLNAAAMVFGMTLPHRFISQARLHAAVEGILGDDKKLTQLEDEADPIMDKINDLQAQMMSQRESSQMGRKKDSRRLRNAEDQLRKKWHDMERILKEMRQELIVLTRIRNYSQGWIPRLVGLTSLPLDFARRSALPWAVKENPDARIWRRSKESYERHLAMWEEIGEYLFDDGQSLQFPNR